MITIQEKITEILVKQTYGAYQNPVDAIIDIIDYMQFWTKFTNEVPLHNELLLVKTKHNDVHTMTFTGHCDIKTSAEYMSLVSWRPVFYNLEKNNHDEN
jgi:hypothetical protein